VRKLAHGTYGDVIVAEHRKRTGADELLAPHVVLEMPERSRVIDKAPQYEIDGVVGSAAPTVGVSYRLVVGPATDATSGASLRYETRSR
jgi:hypothetical protein